MCYSDAVSAVSVVADAFVVFVDDALDVDDAGVVADTGIVGDEVIDHTNISVEAGVIKNYFSFMLMAPVTEKSSHRDQALIER